MNSKLIENIVLAVGLLIIGAAVFLMFFDEKGQAAQSINIIFSVGFIVYIFHSHLLSRNLNREITDLNLNISNLKEEVARLEATVRQRDEELATLNANLQTVKADLSTSQNDLAATKDQLAAAQKTIAQLNQENQTDEA